MMAEMMYTERCVPQGPPWAQLGDVTRAVWIERAMADYMKGLETT